MPITIAHPYPEPVPLTSRSQFDLLIPGTVLAWQGTPTWQVLDGQRMQKILDGSDFRIVRQGPVCDGQMTVIGWTPYVGMVFSSRQQWQYTPPGCRIGFTARTYESSNMFSNGWGGLTIDDHTGPPSPRIDGALVVLELPPGHQDPRLLPPQPPIAEAARRRAGITIPEGDLELVERLDRYSVYTGVNADEVYYLSNADGQPMVSTEDLAEGIEDMWTHLHIYVREPDLDQKWRAFRQEIERLVIDPDALRDFHCCVRCELPTHLDDLHTVREGRACDDCYQDHYSSCISCSDVIEDVCMTTTISGDGVCHDCRTSYWRWCDDCGGWYHREDRVDHRHDGSDCCESPAMSFRIRNDGLNPLEEDTRFVLQLPSGVISDEGIGVIANYLRNQALAMQSPGSQEWADAATEAGKVYQLGFRLPELGVQWQTKKGNYTKRLSRLAYTELGLKVPPLILSQVGTMAREHSVGVDHEIEITRNLNLPREDFCHSGSCWWTDYAHSRCALKTNGGFALRTFDPTTDYPIGRAWVLPLKLTDGEVLTVPAPSPGRCHDPLCCPQPEPGPAPAVGLVPTFETESPAAFMVFNGYGNLEGYAPARIMSHMAGWTYRKIGFTCNQMYVNNESGYLIAPEEIAEGYENTGLHLRADQHANLYDEEKETANV